MQPVHPKKECPTMQLANIELGKLSVSKANMRYGSKAPDVSDILPSIRARGVLVPLLVRPGPVPSDVEGGSTETFEIVAGSRRSEEHTSELQSLMRISYAVFCLKNKKEDISTIPTHSQDNSS